MEKITLTLIFGIIQIGLVFGQCCPYLGNIEIIPENPTMNDSIYLITNVATPNLGQYLGYQIDDNDTIIAVDACYYSGDLTQPMNYMDTINLGKKNAGIYDLTFIAYQSSNIDSCNWTDTNSIQIEFEVQSSSLIEKHNNQIEIDCFPNPATEGKIIIKSNQQFTKVELLDIYGRILKRENEINTNLFEIDIHDITQGVYFIKVNVNEKEIIRKIIIIRSYK